MKITKYLLLSSTVLGIMSPITVLADNKINSLSDTALNKISTKTAEIEDASKNNGITQLPATIKNGKKTNNQINPVSDEFPKYKISFSAIPTNPNYKEGYDINMTYSGTGITSPGRFGGITLNWKGYANNRESLYKLESVSSEGVDKGDDSVKFTFPFDSGDKVFDESVHLTSKTFKSNFTFVDTNGNEIKPSIKEDMPLAYSVHLVPEYSDDLNIPGYKLVKINCSDGDKHLLGVDGPVEDIWSSYVSATDFKFEEYRSTDGATIGISAGEFAGSGTIRPIDFEYVYEKDHAASDAVVTEKYVDELGNNIVDPVVIHGNIGDDYTTEQKVVDGYTFKEVQGQTNGKFTDKDQTVTYIYTKNPEKAADVTVKYVDENNQNIETPTIISGNVNDPFATKQKDFDGYTFHDVKGETSGKLESQSKTVTYTYYKNDGSNHTVNFYDINGQKIADEIKIDGRFEDSYDLTKPVNTTLEELKQQGYKKVSSYGAIKGNFVPVHDGAGYILTKLSASEVGTVKANYVDEQGKTIADSEIKGGKLGSNYKTEKKDIKGYTFKAIKGNETGQLTNKEQTVTYVYTKNPEKGADVTVKYTDENGQELAKSEVKTGNVGDKYTTDKKELAGYTFKEVKGDESGKFTDKAQTVTYIYTRNGGDSVKPSDPSDPAKPDIPDHSDDTDQPADNNSTVNNVVNNVVERVQTMLPKTSTEKVTLVGIVSVGLASLAGLVVWKKRK